MIDVDDPRRRSRRHRRRACLLIALAIAATTMAALQTHELPVMHEIGRITGLGQPRVIELCGRSYEGGDGRRWRLEEVRQHFGVEPVVVEPWLHPACVPGACAEVAAGRCHTVIFARVGEDALAAYALQGGP